MISFFVAGTPVPKGSAKAFMRKGMKHPVVIQDNREKQKPWASAIGYAAQQEVIEILDNVPVSIEIIFNMPRPKCHYGTGKNRGTLKDSAPWYHTSKPDLDKLVRCVKDALTGVVWKDDSMVAIVVSKKVYSDTPGARITITELL